jgi:hypothetical protein
MTSTERHHIKETLNRLESEIRPIKALLRSRWERPMADEQRRLVMLRRRITELFVVLAYYAGKLHVRHPPRAFKGEWDPRAYARGVVERYAGAHPAAAGEPR